MNRRGLFIVASLTIVIYFATIFVILVPLPFISSSGKLPISNSRSNVKWCKELQWREPTLKRSIMLASFPGSGNTWVRYLLQQVTGILTGSVYMDYSLRDHGFPAENVTDGSVLLVKTHYGVPKNIDVGAAVLLIRDPKDAILAEFNRLHKGHIGSAPKKAFYSRLKKISWQQHVESQARGWIQFHASWVQSFKGPLHLLIYEDLIRNTELELRRLLSFLNQTVSDEEMACAMDNIEGIYRRKKKHMNFNPFTKDMELKLNICKQTINYLLKTQ